MICWQRCGRAVMSMTTVRRALIITIMTTTGNAAGTMTMVRNATTITMVRNVTTITTVRNAMTIITMAAAAATTITIIMRTRCLPAGEWKPLYR